MINLSYIKKRPKKEKDFELFVFLSFFYVLEIIKKKKLYLVSS